MEVFEDTALFEDFEAADIPETFLFEPLAPISTVFEVRTWVDADDNEGDEQFTVVVTAAENADVDSLANTGIGVISLPIVSQDFSGGTTTFGPGTNSDQVFRVEAGTGITIAMQGGAGGGNATGQSGGNGGAGTFTLTPTEQFFMRLRVGKEGKVLSVVPRAS